MSKRTDAILWLDAILCYSDGQTWNNTIHWNIQITTRENVHVLYPLGKQALIWDRRSDDIQ